MSRQTQGPAFRVAPRFYAAVSVALGTVLVATAAWAFLSSAHSDGAADATDFSSVPVPVDFAAPSLTLRDLSGEEHSIGDYRGSVVLVNLWATWCPPCQAEMPNLETYFRQHSADGFVVIAVEDGDPAPQVSSFVAQYGLTFPIWLDPTYQATDHAFKTRDLPSSYVIDRNGQVRLRWVGAISQTNLEKYVTPLIQE